MWRVGKTTLLRQIIADADRTNDLGPVLFASVDAPRYAALSLELLLRLFEEIHPHDPHGPRLIIFDEIQYLRDWERHLKDAVDRYPRTRLIASGSAGAALKRKSTESGAGRFTDFELPPLNFAEFLDFSGATDDAIDVGHVRSRVKDAALLSKLFAPRAVSSRTDLPVSASGEMEGRGIARITTISPSETPVLLCRMLPLIAVQEARELLLHFPSPARKFGAIAERKRAVSSNDG
jgi:hypothetical protein